MVIVLSEWCVYESIMLLAGYVGVADQAAMVIILQIATLYYEFPLGMNETIAVLIGDTIG
jgi:Na+-driven multidrug efflux pump